MGINTQAVLIWNPIATKKIRNHKPMNGWPKTVKKLVVFVLEMHTATKNVLIGHPFAKIQSTLLGWPLTANKLVVFVIQVK